jgi:hypothetical protein
MLVPKGVAVKHETGIAQSWWENARDDQLLLK